MAKTNVTKRAEELALKYTSKAPVDVIKISESEGLQAFAQELDPDVSGILIKRGSHSFCFFNSQDHRKRQRFTVAHELGHFLLEHHDRHGDEIHVDKGNFMMFRDQKSKTGLSEIEREANAFAAALLMPTSLLEKEIGKLGVPALSDIDVSRLAETFDVSDQAMTIRLVKLGHL